MMTNN